MKVRLHRIWRTYALMILNKLIVVASLKNVATGLLVGDVPLRGIRMELSPLRVSAPVGQTAVFVCTYFSAETLDIEMLLGVNCSHDSGRGNLSLADAEAVTEAPQLGSVQRLSLGYRRVLKLVLERHHRSLLCRVSDVQGVTIGEITATIHPQGLCIYRPDSSY